MNKEIEYLSAYRALLTKKRQIEKILAELKGVCDGMKGWQRPTTMQTAMPDLAELQKLVASYHAHATDLERLWGNLARDERDGLLGPESLQQAAD